MSTPYKKCSVLACGNTSISVPGKLYFHVPKEPDMRLKWLKAAGRDPTKISRKSVMFFCEDHFDLPRDMENYTQYKVMGSVKRNYLKAHSTPSKFEWSNGEENAGTVNDRYTVDAQKNPNVLTKPEDPLNTQLQRCIFCFKFNEECIPMSPNYLAANKTTLVFNYIQVQLDFTDNSPNTVCKDCDEKLQIMYDFVKNVKAAQETLINVELEKDPRREDIGVQMVTVKMEYDDNVEYYDMNVADKGENYDSTDKDQNDINYDSPDEDDNESDNDTKEGILDSVTIGKTTFKENVTQKRKNVLSVRKTKKAKNQCTELVMDIKEEVIVDDTNYANTDPSNIETPGIYVTLSEAELPRSASLQTMRSDENSENDF